MNRTGQGSQGLWQRVKAWWKGTPCFCQWEPDVGGAVGVYVEGWRMTNWNPECPSHDQPVVGLQ